MPKNLLIAGAVILAVGFAAGVCLNIGKEVPLGYGGSEAFYADSATTTEHGSMWLNSTARQIIQKDSHRHFVRITVAPYSTSTAYIWQATSTDLVTVNGGIPLNSSTTDFYEIKADNLYLGNIQGISDGDTKIYWIAQ